jgi:hypothetical protein
MTSTTAPSQLLGASKSAQRVQGSSKEMFYDEKTVPMDEKKRFSLRFGIEAAPDKPIFDDAPKRLRFFAVDFIKENYEAWVAKDVVARAFCLVALRIATLAPGDTWVRITAEINQSSWWGLFNLLEEVFQDLKEPHGRAHQDFAQALNSVLAEENVGWRMDAVGSFQRQVPVVIRAEEEAAFRELQAPRFAPALVHLETARRAFNARPRRDREVCSEAFDAVESIGKEVFSFPSGTLGDALKAARSKMLFSSETTSALEKLYSLANNHFRHGMTDPFKLSPAETDYVYVHCLAAILLFVRTDQ